MSQSNRRTFLKQAGALAAAASVSAPRIASGQDANEKIVVSVIGCGGRGVGLGGICDGQDDSTVAYVCDPDKNRAEHAKKRTNADHAVADMRKIFDDKSVDAVLIASCDHWHAPAAILAANAGKHVYVEKPCSHNILEGRAIINAGKKNNVVVQHGTQSRSSPSKQKAMQALRDGEIGDVLVSRHVNSQKRSNIGHQTPSDPPAHVDYDLWVGPAAWRDYQSNYVHYHWHWFFNFGTGDIGNDGVHGIDVARWGLGVETHPSFVTGYGSKLYFDDDQEFPDTYSLAFEYPGDGKVGQKRVLIYDQRIWTPYNEDPEGNTTFFYGTKGMMTIGRKIKVFGPRNQLIREEELTRGDKIHQRNFLDAIKDRSLVPNAEINTGHLSSSLCHLGNIVSRTGRAIRFDPQTEKIIGDEEASKLLGREYRKDHWAVPKV